MSDRTKKALVIVGAVMVFFVIMFIGDKRAHAPAPVAQSTACSEAAKVITVMLAKDGYHVTVPKPGDVDGLADIGSTDMNEHTVQEVRAAMNADHDLVMQLRSAGCKRIGFYGDKLGTFGSDINLDDLP